MKAYCREVHKAICNSCSYKGYDVDFEKYISLRVYMRLSDTFDPVAWVEIICPICNKKDTMKLI